MYRTMVFVKGRYGWVMSIDLWGRGEIRKLSVLKNLSKDQPTKLIGRLVGHHGDHGGLNGLQRCTGLVDESLGFRHVEETCTPSKINHRGVKCHRINVIEWSR